MAASGSPAGLTMDAWLRTRLRKSAIDDEILTKYILGVLVDEADPREQLMELLESACPDTQVGVVFLLRW
jgi:hypothetical protein